MDTKTLVANVLLYQENLPSATTGDFVTARKRVKRNAQRAANKIWLHRPWAFRIVDATVVVTAGLGTIPTFNSFGRNGFVRPLDKTKPALLWMPLQKMKELQGGPTNNNDPRWYSMQGQQLLTFPMGSTSLRCSFQRVVPQLNDDEVGIADPDPDELTLIPEDYHETVVYEWTVYFQMKDKANQQSVTEQLRLAEAGLKAMVENERPGIEAAHNVVPYGTGRR